MADRRGGVRSRQLGCGAAGILAVALACGSAGGLINQNYTPVDVVQPFPKGVLLYRGKGGGAFCPAEPAGKLAGNGAIATAVCGDYDADGRLDILLGGPNGCTLLANRDGRSFREVIRETGELIYISKPKVVAASNCDVNNDGRQDVVLFYPNMGFQVFFNRGFRCFGFANLLDLKHSRLAAAGALARGQSAGAVLDFNGDGAQDVLAVTPAGQVCALLRDTKRGGNLGLTVSLPPGRAGPVTVVGYDGKRCLGARSVAAGQPALFGKRAKGPITLKWTLGTSGPQSKRVIVLRPTRWCVPK